MPSETEFKLVVVVRNDLKLRPGKMAVQAAHASVNCALAAKKSHKKGCKIWYDPGQRKGLLKGQGLEELRELQFQAKTLGIPNSLVTDAGLTQIPPGTVTCLGLGPAPEKEIDDLTGRLSLK